MVSDLRLPAILCAALWVAAPAWAADSIYESYSSNLNMPVYTDHPLNDSSHVIAFLEVRRHPRTYYRRSPKLLLRQRQLEPLVERAARAHGLHAALLKAVIDVESGFNAHARSSRGAVGLMQVMPETAARYGNYDLYSPEQNIEVGARYLSDLLSMFRGNVRLAVAAYNAGEKAVLRSGGKIPDYAETQRYVPMVLERYRQYQHYLPAEQ